MEWEESARLQLCIEYAHRYRYYFPDGVFFVDAGADLGHQFASLAPVIDPSGKSFPLRSNLDVLCDAVVQNLSELRRALLILDNVPSARFMRLAVIGKTTRLLALRCPILFNSRQQIEGAEFESLTLGPLSDHDGLELIVRHRPDLADDPDVEQLTKVHGNVPLAVELAGSFLARRPKASVAAYIAELTKNGWQETMSLAGIRAGDVEAYGTASFLPALKAQFGLLENAATGSLLAAAALHEGGTLVPIARLSLMTALYDGAGGLRTPLTDAVNDAAHANLLIKSSPTHVTLHPIVRDYILHHTVDDLALVSRQCLARFAEAVDDLDTVKRNVAERGVDEMAADLRFVDRFGRETGAAPSIVGDLLAILYGQSHVFRGLTPETLDSCFEQQVLLMAQRVRSPLLEGKARAACERRALPYFTTLWTTAKPPEQFRAKLVGHRGTIDHLRVSPTGTRAVSCSSEGDLFWWALSSAELEGRLSAGARLALIEFSPDGNRLAVVVGETRQLGVVDLAGKTFEAVEDAPTGWLSAWFLDQNSIIGIIEGGRTLASIDLKSRAAQNLPSSFDSDIRACTRVDGRRFLFQTADGRFALYDAVKRRTECEFRFEKNDIEVHCARLLDGHLDLATNQGIAQLELRPPFRAVFHEDIDGTWGGYPRIWEYATSVFTANGRYLVSAAHHNFLDVIELGASTRVSQVPSNTMENIIAASENGNVVVSGNSYRSELNLWNFEKAPEQSSSTRHSEEIINVLSLLGGTRLVTASMDWTARLWQRQTGALMQRYGGTLDTGYGKGLAKTVADDRFLVGYTVRTAIYDAESGEQLYSFQPPCDGVTAIGMAPSGRFFTTGSSDGILLIFSEHTELLWQAKVNDAEITCTAVSEDEGWIVWGDTSGNLTLFDVPGGVAKQLSSKDDGIACVMFRPGSDLFYSGHKSGKLGARNAGTGLIMADIQAHSDGLSAFSWIDSNVIASASWDGKIAFWNGTTLTMSGSLNIGEPITCMDYRQEDGILLLGFSVGDLAAYQRITPAS